MPSATVTSKGQVTIPAEVRARLGLRPGSRLAFVATEGGYEIHPQAASIRDLKGAVAPATHSITVDQMNEAIATAPVEDVQ